MLNFRDQTRTGVHRGMVVDTIHLSAVAIALLRFGPFVRSLWAIVSCSVMERGASSTTAPGVPGPPSKYYPGDA